MKTSRLPSRLAFAILLTVSLGLAAVPSSATGDSQGGGNHGTIKVHDEMTASPPTRNEPHVDCEDFWVEGFNMAVSDGDIEIWSWPPTGDKTLVLDADWEADGGEPAHHFLAGPFALPAGHYRVEVSNSEDDDPGDDDMDDGHGAHAMDDDDDEDDGSDDDGDDADDDGGHDDDGKDGDDGGGDDADDADDGDDAEDDGSEGGDDDEGDGKGHKKSKMFWVEPCPANPCPDGDHGDEGCENPCPGGHDDDDGCDQPCPGGDHGDDEDCDNPCPGGDHGDDEDCENPCPGGHGDDECEQADDIVCPTDLELRANADGSILLTWTPAEGSDATNVYKANGTGLFTYVTTVEGSEWLDTDTVPGESYTYTVTGLYGDQESTDCPQATTTAIPVFPTAMAAGLGIASATLAYAFLARRKR